MADLKAWLAKKNQTTTEAKDANPNPTDAERDAVVAPVQQAAPKLALANRFAKKPAATEPLSVPDIGTDFDLSGLADSLMGDGAGSAAPRKSQFADEIPVPKRGEIPADTPDDIRKGMKQFIDLIDGVYGIINDPELLGGVIRSIMIELKSHPQYMQMVAKDDVRLWVKAMRDSMGLARIKKTEAKTKRSGGGAKKGKAGDSDMEQAFADLGINFDNL